MYAIDCEGYTVYTLGRTGSLPVSCFNSQERSQSIGYRYEGQAYHYFATLGCTDLARVVQYTALYQLFIDNNITYSGDTYAAFPKNKPFLLYKPTVELLTALKSLSGDSISLVADSLSQRSFRLYRKEQVDRQLRENEQRHNMTYSAERADAIYANVRRNTQAGIGRSLQEVKAMPGGLGEEQFRQLARFLSYPRGVTVKDRESYNTCLRARKVGQMMREVGKNNLDLVGMDLGQVKNWYAEGLRGSAGRYLKTSSLIITYNDLKTTGGHNLSSRISRVSSMTGYKRRDGARPVSTYPGDEGSGKREAGAGDPKAASPDNPVSRDGARPVSTYSAAKRKPAGTGAKAVKKSGSGPVRPRSSVISTAPRGTRGL